MTAPTYLVFTDEPDRPGNSDVYVEAGEVSCVPLVGQRVDLDGVPYVVESLRWHVYTKGAMPNSGRFPQQCVTAVVRGL